MTLLLRPSVQLNKSLTALKFTFYENVQKLFLSSKSDNVLSTFYSDQLDQQLALYQNLEGQITLLRRTSIQLNKSLTALKFTLYENAQK